MKCKNEWTGLLASFLSLSLSSPLSPSPSICICIYIYHLSIFIYLYHLSIYCSIYVIYLYLLIPFLCISFFSPSFQHPFSFSFLLTLIFVAFSSRHRHVTDYGIQVIDKMFAIGGTENCTLIPLRDVPTDQHQSIKLATFLSLTNSPA